ncbi:MAG: hypothetical protein WCA46_07615 [Actinocatenispora sp.]
MPNPRAGRRPSRYRWLSVIPLVLVLIAAGVFVYVSYAPDSPFKAKLTPISIAQAVKNYRAHPGPIHPDVKAPSTMPVAPSSKIVGFKPPAEGVYSYDTTGGDWVEYNGQKYRRTFPDVTAATVRRDGGCGWELAFQAAKEYSDGHVQCSAPGEFLCLAHISDITFGSVARSMKHVCRPGMVQVGGKADSPNGKNYAVCHAGKKDPSKITITFKGAEKLPVAGKERTAYHVVLDSTVTGDVKGTAVADVWFDSQTGTYLKMVRKQDTYVQISDSSRAYYRVRVTYRLRSLTPQV